MDPAANCPRSCRATSSSARATSNAAGTYEALHKLAKRGTVQQTGQGAKLARWRLL
jgi:hypothetical protein